MAIGHRFRFWRPQARTEALLLGVRRKLPGGIFAHTAYLHSLNCNPKLPPTMPEPWVQPLYNKSVVARLAPPKP